VHPSEKAIFGTCDLIGLPYLTQLIVDLSNFNLNKFLHNFRDTLNPMCLTSDVIEEAEHFLLKCPSCVAQRRDLLANVTDLLRPFINFTVLYNQALV